MLLKCETHPTFELWNFVLCHEGKVRLFELHLPCRVRVFSWLSVWVSSVSFLFIWIYIICLSHPMCGVLGPAELCWAGAELPGVHVLQLEDGLGGLPPLRAHAKGGDGLLQFGQSRLQNGKWRRVHWSRTGSVSFSLPAGVWNFGSESTGTNTDLVLRLGLRKNVGKFQLNVGNNISIVLVRLVHPYFKGEVWINFGFPSDSPSITDPLFLFCNIQTISHKM